MLDDRAHTTTNLDETNRKESEMSALFEHKPEPWFWESGSEHCPHGPEPDRQSDTWDDWAERHTGSPQDVFVCLDAPMGDHCPACFEENGSAVPWVDCPENAAAPTP